MKRSYIGFKGLTVAFSMFISAHAQPDTVVLNRTEFHFPETQPGKVFTVIKAVVNGQQGLKKEAASEAPGAAEARVPSPLSREAIGRDLMGRTLKSGRGGEYADRMARIRKAHALPTVASRASAKEGAFKKPIAERFDFSEGSRFILTSDSPLIQNARDLVRFEKAEREAVRRKYGTLTKRFTEKVNAMREGEELDILIEFKAEHPGFVNGMKASLEERKRNAQAWVDSRPLVAPAEFLRRHGLKEWGVRAENSSERIAIARASREQILELKHAPGVVSVGEASSSAVNAVPGGTPRSLHEILLSAYNPYSTMVEHGGLAVATMEIGLSTAYVGRLPTRESPTGYDVSWKSFPEHSEGTYHALAIGTEGHARYHYIGVGYYWDLLRLNYTYGDGFGHILPQIVSNEISILSSSFASRNHTGSSVAGDSIRGPWHEIIEWDSRNVDRLAFIYPYPVIFLTAGNDGYAVTSDSKAYNSVTVGNVQHYDNTSYSVTIKHAMGPPTFAEYNLPGSQTKNAPATYGSVNDWELPNLVAPGQTPDPWHGMCIPDVHLDFWGTPSCPGGGSSYSAPIAAAMGSHVMAARNRWTPSRNTETRAILMLTAQNVDSGYWAPGLQDSRDGAGTVSGANAVHFATNASDVEVESRPVVDGISSGVFEGDAFGGPESFIYNYETPSSFPSGKHLRVVLTWNGSPGYNYAENEVSDIGLAVQTNYGWTHSDGWNGNTEMLDIHPSDLTPNAMYSIEIYPKVHRTATDGPEYVDYTLAWTWVKDHAD